MSGGIAGKVALVTGAGRGIGRAVADALSDAGAKVAAVDRDLGGRDGFGVDVRDSAAVDGVVDHVERTLGPIDVLVNVAGVLRTGRVDAVSDEDWAEVFAVNATGVFVTCRAVARRMVPRRRGSIVTVSSNAADAPRIAMSAYAASKAAATQFTRCLGLELAGHGIRCNVVSPGSTDTPMQRSLWTDGNGPDSVIAGSPESFRTGIPLGRIAAPSDVAGAVVFLVSDEARHITMHDLRVDGGATPS